MAFKRSVAIGASSFLIAVALTAMTTPALAADAVVCGSVLGFSPATASATGSFVISQIEPPAGPSTTMPAVAFMLPAGTQLPLPSGYVCVRYSTAGATNTFIAIVQAGAPGFIASPTPGPSATGGRGSTPSNPSALPSTSTENLPSDPNLEVPAIALVLLIAAGYVVRWLSLRSAPPHG